MIFIPIGSDCCLAYHLQQLNLRAIAFPFDWLLIPKLECIVNIIQNNFDKFLCQDYLITKNSLPYHSYIEDNWNSNDINTIRVKHSLYKIEFLHDFTSTNSINDIKEKYQRRIINRICHFFLRTCNAIVNEQA